MDGSAFLIVKASLWSIGSVYIGSGIFAPNWFATRFAMEHWVAPTRDGMYTKDAAWFWYLSIPLIFFSVGVVIYSAVYPLIDVIPHDWGGHDEEGEWQSTRDQLQWAASVVGSLALCAKFEDRAREVRRDLRDRP